MLREINIKNLAIIEDLKIDFKNNFTALTGETGAGKSLIIDSLKLIFGKRADSDYIRYGEDEAIIKVVFTELNNEVKEYLEKLNIFAETITIERWISRVNRNKILINDNPCSLQDLKELGLLIGDIHEQHDTTKLLDPNTPLEMIDQFGKNDQLLNEYVFLRYNYLTSLKRYEEATIMTEKNEALLDTFKYQLEEISKAGLIEGELKELEVKINTLKNKKEIVDNLTIAYNNLTEINEKDLLYSAFKKIAAISSYLEPAEEISKRLENSYYEIDDLQTELFNQLDNLKDYSLLELETLESRYYFLIDLEKKYQMKTRELIVFQNKLEEDILKIENFDLFLEKLKENSKRDYQLCYKKGQELSQKRQTISLKLEKEFVEILKRLDINYVNFKIDFQISKETLFENGIDEIVFLMSLNEGEPLKPFYKVASGGELSRSMLALKILYGQIHNLGLMIFDEIDLGISGDAASKVANELLNLSQERQIITITHLPQVAAKADSHYNIEKQVKDGKTITKVIDLDNKKRVYQLAYMLSGKNITEGAILHAETLLKK